MRVFVFPGQGSQKRGMGAGCFDRLSELGMSERAVDDMLGYSIRRLCIDDPDNMLRLTQFAQPALYVTGALHYHDALRSGDHPAYLAGHSIGEYAALFAAGVFDFPTGLRLVQKRAELTARAVNGAMAAVVGLDETRIVDTLRDGGLSSIDISNYNSAQQIVISGLSTEIERAGPLLQRAGATLYVPLSVSGAFHSRHMRAASEEFALFLRPFIFARPVIPVIANVTGQPYSEVSADVTVKALLARQIREPVRWMQSIQYVLARGATSFRELGPGNVLTRLIRQIQ